MKRLGLVFGIILQTAGILACGFVIVSVVGRQVPDDRAGFLAAVVVGGAVAASVGGRIADACR